MLQLIFVVGLSSAVLGSPQWYGGHQPVHAGYGGAHLGAAPLGADGRVVDTPEVLQAKAHHFAALANARANAPKDEPHGGAHYNDVWNGPNQYAPAHYDNGLRGPPAPLGTDGRVVDTPEVVQAKAHHFALFNAAAQQSAPAGPSVEPHYDGHHAGDYNSGAYNPAWDSPSWNH